MNEKLTRPKPFFNDPYVKTSLFCTFIMLTVWLLEMLRVLPRLGNMPPHYVPELVAFWFLGAGLANLNEPQWVNPNVLVVNNSVNIFNVLL